jgi:uncharacterized membrane protein (UPF0127 family)
VRRVVFVDPRGERWIVDVPESRRERVRGLRGVTSLDRGHGMLLKRCRSIHTFGMRFTIDVVLLDRAHRVVALLPVRPGRVTIPRLGVRHVLECPAGSGLRPGDRLTLDPGSPEDA